MSYLELSACIFSQCLTFYKNGIVQDANFQSCGFLELDYRQFFKKQAEDV